MHQVYPTTFVVSNKHPANPRSPSSDYNLALSNLQVNNFFKRLEIASAEWRPPRNDVSGVFIPEFESALAEIVGLIKVAFDVAREPAETAA